MTTTMFSTLSLWLFLAVAVANLGFSFATTAQWANKMNQQTRCIPAEREALLEFKKHLVDRSNRLETWTAAAANDDCCSWYGVSCHHQLGNSTTHYVTGLHLRSLSPSEFYDLVDYMKMPFGTIETVLLRTKGNMLEYSGNLGLFRSLDLSNNKLCGKIPDEITGLDALASLNLSHNALSGEIPKNIGFMKELGSMDLSANQLSGEIPQSISKLTYLGKLNLSHNRLSGGFSSGNQIQTFNASTFVDNELFGSPLPNTCGNEIVPNEVNDEGDEDGDGMKWFYLSMTFGFVWGLWCFVCPLLLDKRWRFTYSQFLDRMWNRIWWKLHVLGMF